MLIVEMLVDAWREISRKKVVFDRKFHRAWRVAGGTSGATSCLRPNAANSKAAIMMISPAVSRSGLMRVRGASILT